MIQLTTITTANHKSSKHQLNNILMHSCTCSLIILVSLSRFRHLHWSYLSSASRGTLLKSFKRKTELSFKCFSRSMTLIKLLIMSIYGLIWPTKTIKYHFMIVTTLSFSSLGLFETTLSLFILFLFAFFTNQFYFHFYSTFFMFYKDFIKFTPFL